MSKKYDVVVFGATGFTGQLVCKYLLSHPEQRPWAVAGRSASRLASLKKSLKLPDTVGVIEAETAKYDTLTAMTSQARVLINIVGPYRPFNAVAVVRACLESSTHYVDLSGETGFNSDCISHFHADAQAKGVVIANSVGFDSLPFDLSTFLAAQKAKQLSGKDVALAECAYELFKDFSAGTLASAVSMASEKQQMFAVRGDWLSPISKPHSLDFASPVRWFEQRRKWGAQHTISIHNTRTVTRTWGLLQHHSSPSAYGSTFAYKEGTLLPNRIVAYIVAYVGVVLIWVLMNIAPIRALIARSMKPNSGPSEHSLVNSRLRVDTLATATDGTKAICKMSAKGHPGYLLTARMITEAALTILATSDRALPGVKGGVLTPALLGADTLADRLSQFAHFDIRTEAYEDAKKR